MDAHTEMTKVLAMSVQDATAWMRAAEVGEIQVAWDFNWIALAEAMATFAVDTEDPAWAILGAELNKRLASKENDYVMRERRIHAAMQLHALLISRFKVSDGASRACLINTWFSDRLPMPIEQALECASSWPTLPIEQIRTLREIKYRLNVLAVLEHDGALAPYPELARWLSIRERLP